MSRILEVDVVSYCGCCGATRPTRYMAWTGTGWLCRTCSGGYQVEVLAQDAARTRQQARSAEMARLFEQTHTEVDNG